MLFELPGEQYDRFMGRFSRELAPRFADFAGVRPGMRALDVGCGTGMLTAELVRRLGARAVAAIDPAEPLLAVCRTRVPDADVRLGQAERLPWADQSFDAALAQLVVVFMQDPLKSVRELRRVLRKDGTLATCMWAAGAEMELLDVFWRAARTIDPQADAHELVRYRTREELDALWGDAGARDIELAPIDVRAAYTGFADYWDSVSQAAGPARAFVTKLAPAQLDTLREGLQARLPAGKFSLAARAWAVRGRA